MARRYQVVFGVNVPIVAAAIGCAAVLVPESRAAVARRFDPVGQTLIALVMGCVVYAVIESTSLGWTSPVIIGLLAFAALGVAGIAWYEPRRAAPLLPSRLLRSVPFTSAIATALFALCGFGAFLFVTTQYLQDVRGLPPMLAGLCLLPVGVAVLVLSPLTGRAVGRYSPLPPLLVAGTALAAGGGASLWLGPATPLPAVLAVYLLFGVFLGTVNPPVTNTAIPGMPRSMAALAGSLTSTGRQMGTTLGIAISDTIIAPSFAGDAALTNATHSVWWLTLALGAGMVVLALAGSRSRSARAADRAIVGPERAAAPAAGR